MKAAEGQKVKVTVIEFLECSFRCGTCGTSNHRRSAVNRNGRYVLRCHVCSQEIVRDEAGQWKRLNNVVKEGHVFRVSEEAPDLNPVSVEEKRRVEGYKFSCPCGSQNKIGDYPMADYKPLKEWRDKDFHTVQGVRISCWSCGLVLEENTEGGFIIVEEGRS